MSQKNKDRKDYFKKYFDENKDKLKEDFICEICGGKYKYMNKANHIKTQKHKTGVEMQKLKKDNEAFKNIFTDINKKIENI